MKKVLITILVIILFVLGGMLGFLYYQNNYVTIGGERYARGSEALEVNITSLEDLQKLTELTQLKQLDLGDSQITTSNFTTLQIFLPQCQIRWQVPFQDGYVSSDVTTLTLTSLSNDDMEMLKYFTKLETVDATGCADFALLADLMERYPELDLRYNVPMAGQSWPQDTAAITLATADLAEMNEMLAYLPQVQTVTFTELVEDPDAMLALQEAYPGIIFSWQLEVCGVTVDASASEIDLSEIQMADTAALESKLKYMPNLTKVDMCHCGISNEEMEALNNRHEDILFVWMVKIKGMEFRTDVTEMMPVKHDLWVNDADCENLRYFTELIALDLGHMFIYNCEFVRYMPHLKYLILADTDVGDMSPLEGLEELIYLEIFMCPVKDYSPLLTLTALEDLNICYTYGDYEIIAQMTWLDRLWWGQVQTSRITDAQRQYLIEALPDTEIEYEPHSSTGAGWREGQNYYDMRDIFGMPYMTK